eukprot:2562832-Rhodomonas_salina.1
MTFVDKMVVWRRNWCFCGTNFDDKSEWLYEIWIELLLVAEGLKLGVPNCRRNCWRGRVRHRSTTGLKSVTKVATLY